MVSSYIVRTCFSPDRMASSLTTEDADTEDEENTGKDISINPEVEVEGSDRNSVSENDGNDQTDCDEANDADEHRSEDEIPTRVISLVDQEENLNHSVISVDSSVAGSVVEVSPSKLRRSARASARRYRQSNKVTSSDSDDAEVVFVKKTQKRKESKSSRRKSRHGNSDSSDDNGDETPEKKVTKESKKSEKKETKSIKHVSDTNKKSRDIKVNGNHHNKPIHPPEKFNELELIKEGITLMPNFFDDSMCRKIEKKIDQIAEKAKCGLYKQRTYDRAPLRNKYFFGEGYTYGKFMAESGPGKEQVYPKGEVDEIPKWIEKHIIKKLYDDNIVEEGFINSAVINEYFAGGCIVSHIDPIHIFDRPIISISFNCKTYLSFGCKFSFNPIRTSDPIHTVPLERGCLFKMDGYAADNVTHCVRPQDIVDRRCVIIFRRVFPDAPRVGDIMTPEHPLSLARRKHPRTFSYENTRLRSNRKRPRQNHYEQESNRKRTRHSY